MDGILSNVLDAEDIPINKNYYGFAHEVNQDDPRQEEWKKQREEKGFDDTETWSLDTTIVDFILPRLKRFKELNNGYPPNLTSESWDEILDEMILAFEEYSKKHNVSSSLKMNDEIVDKGFNLFIKYFHDLWW